MKYELISTKYEHFSILALHSLSLEFSRNCELKHALSIERIECMVQRLSLTVLINKTGSLGSCSITLFFFFFLLSTEIAISRIVLTVLFLLVIGD